MLLTQNSYYVWKYRKNVWSGAFGVLVDTIPIICVCASLRQEVFSRMTFNMDMYRNNPALIQIFIHIRYCF